MSGGEDVLAMAERHVREGEARISRQEEIIAEMDRDNHPHAAEMGRKLLATYREFLRLSREHLEAERAARSA